MKVQGKIARIAAAIVAMTLVMTGCSAGTDGTESGDGGEIVITCTTCAGGDDPFLKYRHDLAGAFNKKHAGRYRIDMLPNVVGAGAELEQSYQRRAIAQDLPDLFVHTSASLAKYDKAQPLMDFGPLMQQDKAFADTFYNNMFGFLTLDSGKVMGIPEQRDIVGVYYNNTLLDRAGITNPPTTWEAFRSTAEAVRKEGSIPVAVDGFYVTQLWLTHLIGTQPGGADYLNSKKVLDGGFADNPLWTTAVEYLRNLHTDRLVNEDAFTGDFQRASTPFLAGQAAAITNGPWYTADLAGKTSAKGLAKNVIYAAAPGDGVAVAGGDSAWASAADEPDKKEAVWAFIKFGNTFEQQFERTVATGSFGPIKGTFTKDQRGMLNPQAVALVEKANDVPNTYPVLISLVPAAFQDAWRNYWPAYVQGDEDTRTFLTHLSDSLAS